MHPKIVFIGAGSRSFAPGVLRDLYRSHDLAGLRLALVDTDVNALARMKPLIDRLQAESGRTYEVSFDTDRRRALEGADYVIVSIAVERLPLWRQDFIEPLRHGFKHCYGENGGPGALFHTLRNLPIVMGIARDMEDLSPTAWMITFTNPENRVCLCLHRHSRIRTIGLCHGINGTLDLIAGRLGIDRSRLDAQAAGVNHLTWLLRLWDKETGEDLMLRWRADVDANGPPPGYEMCCKLWDVFDCFPTTGDSHVGEFLSFGAEYYTRGFEFADFAGWAEQAGRELDALGSGVPPITEWLSHGSAEIAVRAMEHLHFRKTGKLMSVIVPNAGAVPNLPEDAVVETGGLFDCGEVAAEPTPPIPPVAAAVTRRELEIQELAVEAWARRSRKAALQALLLDPCVDSITRAELLLDRMVELQGAYLPELR